MLGNSGIAKTNSPRVIRGQLKLPTQDSSGGILIGEDTHIYRNALDKFGISDHIKIEGTKALYFRDGALLISSKNDGHLDLDADVSIDLNGGSNGVLCASYLDMNNNNIVTGAFKQCKVHSDARATPLEGDLKWDAVNHKLLIYNGSAWETVTSAE